MYAHPYKSYTVSQTAPLYHREYVLDNYQIKAQ